MLQAFPSHGADRSCGTILLVEDEPLVRFDLAEQLRSEGFTVIEAANAAEAVSLLTCDFSVDAVCTDVRMPGDMDGIGLVTWIAKQRPGVPTLIISGEATARYVAGLADAAFAKPVLTKALVLKLDELIAKARVRICLQRPPARD